MLNAADFGAHTKRERLFVVARRGRSTKPIPWPEPTHGREDWKPASEIIDWSMPCQSIFERRRPLKARTIDRIIAGIEKFCGENAEPFLVKFRGTNDAASIHQPAPTITAKGTHLGVAVPFLTKYHAGKDP